MAKTFNQTTRDLTAEETRETILKTLESFKNPFASQNPFTDNQKVTFEKWQIIDWTNSDGQKGSYLAIKFKELTQAMALSMALKNGYGYDTAEDLKNDTNYKEYANEGGLCDVMKKYSQLSEKAINDIEKFFEKSRKIKVTKFYAMKFGNVKICTITNVI